jgi:predicted nucleic acid-binding protein
MLERAILLDCVLTLQALGEFYAACTRKGFATRAEAAAQVRRWLDLFPGAAAATAGAVEAALAAAATGRFGYWDALLLATAAEAGCAAVISEDMAPGAMLGDVRVVPAFAGGAAPSPEALAVLGAA